MDMYEVHIGNFRRPLVVLMRAEDEEHARASVELQFAAWFEVRVTVWSVRRAVPADYGQPITNREEVA
jgi:hypothetical protein